MPFKNGSAVTGYKVHLVFRLLYFTQYTLSVLTIRLLLLYSTVIAVLLQHSRQDALVSFLGLPRVLTP